MTEVAGTSGGSPRALVACIDDDESIREALKGLLYSLGFAVEVFDSAERFLQRGRFTDIACLVTDVRLGGMSGLALQSRVAAFDCPIPMVIITAVDDPQLQGLALKGGALGFLRKPIYQKDLLACIEIALRQPTHGRVS